MPGGGWGGPPFVCRGQILRHLTSESRLAAGIRDTPQSNPDPGHTASSAISTTTCDHAQLVAHVPSVRSSEVSAAAVERITCGAPPAGTAAPEAVRRCGLNGTCNEYILFSASLQHGTSFRTQTYSA